MAIVFDMCMLKNHTCPVEFKWGKKKLRKFLKIFLLVNLRELFLELLAERLIEDQYGYMEWYMIDSTIIQTVIQEIMETGEYTLEGIAFHTRVPFDIIYDAVCGISNKLSITFWARVVNSYIQVKPEVARALVEKLLRMIDGNKSGIYSFLVEK